jgi:hypothetical protein
MQSARNAELILKFKKRTGNYYMHRPIYFHSVTVHIISYNVEMFWRKLIQSVESSVSSSYQIRL